MHRLLFVASHPDRVPQRTIQRRVPVERVGRARTLRLEQLVRARVREQRAEVRDERRVAAQRRRIERERDGGRAFGAQRFAECVQRERLAKVGLDETRLQGDGALGVWRTKCVEGRR